ncbi:hypothetical protein LOZ58_002601 [Ophidiomyces ophidiicola]|nr:hypothetical protein LOZ58_002601 [Ophidiomyces ophidiicola]
MGFEIDQVVNAGPAMTPDADVGLLATKDIGVGESVLEMERWIAVLDSAQLGDTCSHCFDTQYLRDSQPNEKPLNLKLCAGCKTVRYCRKDCQVQSWRAFHKYECKIYKKLHPKILPTSARAVMRIVLLITNSTNDPGSLMPLFHSLTDHRSKIKKERPEHYENLELCAKAVHEYSNTDLSIEEIILYFAKLDTSAFTLTCPFGDPIGIAVHPNAGFCNHSCSPNTSVDFDGSRVFARALRKISKGEQIYISYIEATDPYAVRQHELSSRYFFKCKCSKCKKGDKGREDQFLRQLAQADSAIIQDAQKQVTTLLEAVKIGNSAEDSISKLRSGMSILRKTSLWPLTRQPYVKLRSELVVSLLEAKNFESAFIQLAIIYLRIDPILYPQSWHPLLTCHKWRFVKLLMHLAGTGELGNAEGIDLAKYKFDLHILIYSILLNMNATLCNELPTVQQMAYGALLDFAHPQLTTTAIIPMIDLEWKKMNAMVEEALQIDEASI